MRNPLLSAALAALAMTMSSPAIADDHAQHPHNAAQSTQTKKMAAPHDDHAYSMQMAQHHRDGIAMADAVIANGKSDDVKDIARRIKSDQQRDLATLEGHKGPKMDKNAKMIMPPKDPDMQREMSELKAAKGAEADRKFLELMITHHASALMMTHTAMPHLADAKLKSKANEMFAKQAKDIGELQRLRETNRSAQR